MPTLMEPQSNDATALTPAFQALHDRLMDWALHPEEFAEEGMISPSRETIDLAIRKVLCSLNPNGAAWRVAPDTHGGIAFERRDNGDFESIRVNSDGHIEQCQFHDGRLVQRQPWL